VRVPSLMRCIRRRSETDQPSRRKNDGRMIRSLVVSECKRETAGREHVNRLNVGEIHVSDPLMRDVQL